MVATLGLTQPMTQLYTDFINTLKPHLKRKGIL